MLFCLELSLIVSWIDVNRKGGGWWEGKGKGCKREARGRGGNDRRPRILNKRGKYTTFDKIDLGPQRGARW
jgi:hypothetical protein